MNHLILIFLKWTLIFCIHIDASNITLDVMLIQNLIGREYQSIAYANWFFNFTKCNYLIIKYKFFVIVYEIKKF